MFAAKTGQLYDADMAILPSLAGIQTPDDKVRLVILERPSHDLPPAFVDWWKNHRQPPNQILVLTVDTQCAGMLRATARQMKAISIVEKAVLQRTGKDLHAVPRGRDDRCALVEPVHVSSPRLVQDRCVPGCERTSRCGPQDGIQGQQLRR